jgi:hypothetical protein
MKYYLLILTAIGLLARFSPAAAISGFEVNIKPNSSIPLPEVYSDGPSLIKYNHSRSEIVDYAVEVRGRCVTPTSKLTLFQLKINDQTVLDIPVSGNNGNQWDSYNIRSGFQTDHEALIAVCNSAAVKRLQHHSHDAVFNTGFSNAAINSGKLVSALH